MGRTTTEEAAAIRQELKKRGWSARQVSVRSEYFSMGSSITVTVKDPTVPIDVVEEVAKCAERIDRCQITGEILSGGNRYVHVSYSREAERAVMAPWLALVQAAVDAVEPGSNLLQNIEGTPFRIERPDKWRVRLWDDRYLRDGDVESIAQSVGRMMSASAKEGA